ncbi:MAG: hypothetical protein CMC31_02645 [Flavobacteriaceae bacterium]|nr:hypothetical protein [Flavobacteriaceae bacterium]
MRSRIKPTKRSERIQSLDILRGFAVLGILIMNIQSFSMPGSAYSNPLAYGDLTGINKLVWIVSHILADQKFMNIFSILYGAGIILVTSRAELKTGKSIGLHYRRTFWLLILGLIHAHLIWYGDILVAYSISALILFPLRKLRPSVQFIIGVFLFSIHSIIYLFFGNTINYWPSESISETAQSWAPTIERINYEIEMITGTLSQQVQYNSAVATYLETNYFISLYGFWRVSGLMLIGMSLYKCGFLIANKSNAYYKKVTLIVLPTGFIIVIIGVIKNFNADWNWTYSMFLGSQFNYWGSLLISIGYISLIMLFSKYSYLNSFKKRLASIGQMALTNYIVQSVISVLIFFGVGFSLFGQVDRWIQVLIVLAIWFLQLLWSKPWLNRYRYGPLEWLWRSLSYGKIQALINK